MAKLERHCEGNTYSFSNGPRGSHRFGNRIVDLYRCRACSGAGLNGMLLLRLTRPPTIYCCDCGAELPDVAHVAEIEQRRWQAELGGKVDLATGPKLRPESEEEDWL